MPTGAHTRCVGAGEGRGLAFIEFVNNRDAEDAKYGMDRQIMDGKEVRGCLTLRLLAHVHHVAEQKSHNCTNCQECPEASLQEALVPATLQTACCCQPLHVLCSRFCPACVLLCQGSAGVFGGCSAQCS